jgi:hypothetical protein
MFQSLLRYAVGPPLESNAILRLWDCLPQENYYTLDILLKKSLVVHVMLCQEGIRKCQEQHVS